MSKFSYIIGRLGKLNYRAFVESAIYIKKKSGKAVLPVMADMVYCGAKYGAGYCDYRLFRFDELTREERKTYITRQMNDRIVRKLNSREFYHYFDDKADFAEKFSAFTGREILPLKNADKRAVDEFLQRHNSVLLKPADGKCGKGIDKLDADNPTEIYDAIGKNFVLEECLVQHEKLSELYPDGVNTIRVVTMLKNGEVHIPFCFLRIGSKGSFVDNFNSHGLLCPVDVKTGITSDFACTKDNEIFENHPDTGVPTKGFQIPEWRDVIDMCRTAAKVVPEMGYIGWDVCVTPGGAVLIEGNNLPGYDVLQMPAHRHGEKVGKRGVVEAIFPGIFD